MKKIIASIATVFTLVFGFHAAATVTANPLIDYSAHKITLTSMEALT